MIVNIDLPCQALEQDGNMCGKPMHDDVYYCGDRIYHDRIRWVKVNLCKEHYAKFKRVNVDEIKS
jgi:hypothetical protein